MLMEHYFVNVPTLSLLESSDALSEAVDEVLYGWPLEVIAPSDAKADRNEAWIRVRTFYGYEGHVSRETLLPKRMAADVYMSGDLMHYVHFGTIDIMVEPKYASAVMLTLPRGSWIIPTGRKEDKWQEVVLLNGASGWVRDGFLRPVCPLEPYGDIGLPTEMVHEKRKNIIKGAKMYMDTQYRWGGRSSLGIDCSGLVQMSYMANGLLVPRDANQQEDLFEGIEADEAVEGDLYFFPGHVAIALGGGRYIHATGREGYVLENSLNPWDPEYRDDLAFTLRKTGRHVAFI